MHHRSRWSVRHGSRRIRASVPRAGEEHAEQHAFGIVGFELRGSYDAGTCGVIGVGVGCSHRALDLAQACGERGDRREAVSGLLAQRRGENGFDIRPGLDPARREREWCAIANRAMKHASLELKILVVLAGQ